MDQSLLTVILILLTFDFYNFSKFKAIKFNFIKLITELDL